MATATEIRKERERMETLRAIVKKHPKIDMGITNKNKCPDREDLFFMLTTIDDLDEFHPKRRYND